MWSSVKEFERESIDGRYGNVLNRNSVGVEPDMLRVWRKVKPLENNGDDDVGGAKLAVAEVEAA